METHDAYKRELECGLKMIRADEIEQKSRMDTSKHC